MIDLDKLDANDRSTQKVYLTGGPSGLDSTGFEVLGINSAEYLAAEPKITAMSVRRGKERASNTAVTDEVDDAKGALEWTQVRSKLIAMECTVGWFGFVSEGKDVPFSRDALEQLLSKRPRWAVIIATWVENEGLFTKG